MRFAPVRQTQLVKVIVGIVHMKRLLHRKPTELNVKRALKFTSQQLKKTRAPLELTHSTSNIEAWEQVTLNCTGGSTISGILLEYSSFGARIRIQSKGDFPKCAKLISSRSRLNRDIEIVWRRDFDIGIKFIDSL